MFTFRDCVNRRSKWTLWYIELTLWCQENPSESEWFSTDEADYR